LLAALVVAGGGAATWAAIERAAAGGAPLRTIPLAAPGAAGSVLVDERAGRALLIAGGPRSVLSTLDTRSSDVLRAIRLPGHLMAAAAVATRAGHAFVLNTVAAYSIAGHTVSMFATRTGALLRTVRVPRGPFAVPVDEQNGHVFVTSIGAMTAAAGSGGVISVSMLDAHTGALLRMVPVHLGRGTVEMAADGRTRRVFVMSYAGNAVGVLDAQTGTVIRTVAVGKHPGCIAIDDVTGHVFVGNEDSHSVSMLDARTGNVLRSIPVGYPLGLAVDARAGRVFVAADQSIRLLDANTGAVLRTLNVGGGPEGVAVDSRTSRAFVTSTGNHVSTLIHWLGHGQLSWLGEWSDEYTTVLDTRTGAIVQTIRAGGHTRDVAVDARAGHAFVANYRDNSISMLDATR
jgi:YVTN family beta-propeller protein